MSTTEIPTDPGVDQMPFDRVFRTELRKLVDTRASRALLAAVFLLTPVVVVVTLFVADHADLTYDDLVNYCQTPQKVLLPAIAVLAITSEWSQRTALATFTLVPDRSRVVTAKVATIVLLAVALTVVVFASALLGMALAPATGTGLRWDFGPTQAASMFLIQVVGALQGAALGLATLSSAGALIAFYVAPNLWSLLLNALGLQEHAPWVDINQALGAFYGHTQSGTAGLHLLTAVSLWVLAPALVGCWRIARAEPA